MQCELWAKSLFWQFSLDGEFMEVLGNVDFLCCGR